MSQEFLIITNLSAQIPTQVFACLGTQFYHSRGMEKMAAIAGVRSILRSNPTTKWRWALSGLLYCLFPT